MQAQVSQIDQTLADSKAVLRNVQDNLRLRVERRSLEALEQQIDELDEDAARKAYRKFESDYNEQRRKQTELQAEVRPFLSPQPLPLPPQPLLLTLLSTFSLQQARLGGEIQTLGADVTHKGEELVTEYKDIDDRYRRELINLKVRPLSIVRSRSSSRTDSACRRRPRCRTRTSRSSRRRSTGASHRLSPSPSSRSR